MTDITYKFCMYNMYIFLFLVYTHILYPLYLFYLQFNLCVLAQQCDAKLYQHETLFLGVGILDRFLSRGFFKTEKNLQIVGIACLALATRIEENQPYNR